MDPLISLDTAPPETFPAKTYLLASDHQGKEIVSVHIKRTYRLRPDGRCVRAEGEIPLLFGSDLAEAESDFSESDIVPFKQRTDLVVMAKAWGRGARQISARIRIGQHEVNYRVSGNRRVLYRGQGTWTFAQPEPFEFVEMRYENAYGGFDDTVALPTIKHVEDMLSLDPGVYPRNPVGKGYVVFENQHRMDGLALPNIENPSDPLTPQRLVSGHPHHWWRQPLPWSCNWFPKAWYPRSHYYGATPDGLPGDDRQVPEVRLGYLDAGHVRRASAAGLDASLDGRFADAASPALILPSLKRLVPIELVGLSPEGRMVVALPDDQPRVCVRHLGRVEEASVKPHRILVSLLEMGVYVVWHAAWYPPADFFHSLPDSGSAVEALLGRVEVFADKEKLLPMGAEPTGAKPTG